MALKEDRLIAHSWRLSQQCFVPHLLKNGWVSPASYLSKAAVGMLFCKHQPNILPVCVPDTDKDYVRLYDGEDFIIIISIHFQSFQNRVLYGAFTVFLFSALQKTRRSVLNGHIIYWLVPFSCQQQQSTLCVNPVQYSIRFTVVDRTPEHYRLKSTTTSFSSVQPKFFSLYMNFFFRPSSIELSRT